MIHSQIRDGSLRQAATQQGIPVLLYEAGEALRFDAMAIQIGVNGILQVMSSLGMYQPQPIPTLPTEMTPQEIRKTHWVRAAKSGILML